MSSYGSESGTSEQFLRLSFEDDPNSSMVARSSTGERAVDRRTERRRQRRAKAPAFQFVTATDLKQFKDPSTMKNVRAQVMLQHLKKQEREASADTGCRLGGSTTEDSSSSRQASPESSRRILPHTHHEPTVRIDLPAASSSRTDVYSSLSYPPVGGSGLRPPEPLVRRTSSDFVRRRSPSYENSEECEDKRFEEMFNAYLRLHPEISGGVIDPSLLLPKFSHPGIDTETLLRTLLSVYGTPSSQTRWIPIAVQHPLALLSACCIASTHIDMSNGESGDSELTALVKLEIYGWLHDRIANPTTQADDLTALMILQLFLGNVWTCDENAFQIHQAGLERIVAQRGGLKNLTPALAEMIACSILEGAITRETLPDQSLLQYRAENSGPQELAQLLPESPLYCPYYGYFSLSRSADCSPHTFAILQDMKQLTELFLAQHKQQTMLESGAPAISRHSSTSSVVSSYDLAIAAIRDRIAALPSILENGPELAGDWVYESVRIASLIYTQAIIHRLPFSSAADLVPGFLSRSQPSQNTNLPVALYEALYNTDTSQCWGDLNGVYHWVALTGATAARQTSIPSQGSLGSVSEEQQYRIWVRRCLSMYATRARMILQFKHPTSVIVALSTFSRIQEILGASDDWRTGVDWAL